MDAKYFSKAISIGISSPEVKLAHALVTNKKLPEDYINEKNADNYFICEGDWALLKLIEFNVEVPYFFVCPENVPEKDLEKVQKMSKYARKVFLVSEKTCAKISDRDGADYCFSVGIMKPLGLKDIELHDNMTSIILDGQEQPGNIGAILRSLDAAGGEFAIYTNKRCKMTHSRLIRSSLGAAFTMPFVYAEFNELTEWLEKNKFKAMVTDLTATKNCYEVDYNGRIAIVCGNEYLGISPEWRKLPITEPIIIPMLGSVESLNVGFASTLVAYECSLRQKKIISR